MMVEITRILCPVDFSDHARHALDHAAALARWYEAAITLLYVHPMVPVAASAPGAPAFPPYVVTAADRDELVASMETFAAGTGAGVPMACEVVEGGAVAGILSRAVEWPSDLIVMGTHGRSGFERLILGSVTEKVLRKAPCPVLSVPPRVHDAAPPLFRNILCPVDFSDCSLRALTYAMSLAQEADARLTVMHVIERPHDSQDALAGMSPGVRAYFDSTDEERRARLQAVVPDQIRAYCRVDTLMAVGKPYREILSAAADRHSDLVVIGVHGRPAADVLFFGSTTQHVVRAAPCPVLTLRQ